MRPVPLPLAAMYSRRIPWAWPRVLDWVCGGWAARVGHGQNTRNVGMYDNVVEEGGGAKAEAGA